ncbi:MAG: flagellar hook assembly protein FlgD [Legionella sp.]|uniref:flagellar hook assembly protein FlgD n=1 Tax=Legionella sp. TaxID=459 RepID=UPI0039E447CA
MTTNAITGAGTMPIPPQNQLPAKNLGQQDFLRLMVAQIQNQDPMQPQVNGEFLSQLAQFSTNDGVSKMQESMQQMANSLQSNQALQASALVGRKVLVSSESLKLEKEGDVKTAIDIPKGASNIVAYVYADSGELVKTMHLGAPEPGFFQFAWDGAGQDGKRLGEGKYKVAVHGTYMGQEVAFKTMTSSNVDSVSLEQNGEGLKLNVAGVGAVSLDQVRQITV